MNMTKLTKDEIVAALIAEGETGSTIGIESVEYDGGDIYRAKYKGDDDPEQEHAIVVYERDGKVYAYYHGAM